MYSFDSSKTVYKTGPNEEIPTPYAPASSMAFIVGKYEASSECSSLLKPTF